MSSHAENRNSYEEEGDSHMSPIRDENGYADHHGSGSSVGSSWAPGASSRRSSQQGSRNDPIESSTGRRTAESTEEHPLSFQDRVVQAAGATGSSALFGTIELLKLAGGVTLSTTGKIMSPSIQVTTQVIIPALWTAFTDYVHHIAPDRLKDWFRIVRSSLYHFITVLKNTHKGITFRKKVVTVGADVLDCLSSDASRQVIVDGMATVVKLAEALHTPETKAFLDQISVLGCRLVDAASSGRNKQLLKDTQEAVWAFCQLASDPSTTLALAEVTACLCHALEMEEAIHRNQPIPSHLAAQRRYERNQFQRQTHVDPDVIQDPETSVEQVILSSLGAVKEENKGVPRNVEFDHPLPLETTTAVTDNEMDLNPQDEWKNAARESVDVKYLQQQISQRAASMEHQYLLRTTVTNKAQHTVPTLPAKVSPLEKEEYQADIEDLIVSTTDGDDQFSHDPLTMQRQRTMKQSNVSKLKFENCEPDKFKSNKDENDVLDPPPSAISPPNATFDTEKAASRFFRILDEMMEKRGAEVVRTIIRGSESGIVGTWYSKAAAAAGAGNERGQDTLKQRIRKNEIFRKSEIGVGNKCNSIKRQHLLKEKESFGSVAFAVLAGLFACTWFILGSYGLYVIISGSSKSGDAHYLDSVSSTLKPSPPINEFVIRVVREVVHVSSDGNILHTHAEVPQVVDIDKIAQCVAAP